MENINRYIQYTDVSPLMTKKELEIHCQKVLEYGFNAAMVAPCWASYAVEILKGSESHAASCFAFPDGNDSTEMKVSCAKSLIDAGVKDFDFTSNTGYLLSGMYDEFYRDLKAVSEIAADAGAQTKVIIEFGLLTEELRKIGAEMAVKADINFLKQSSGYINGIPAVPKDIEFLKKIVAGSDSRVKASGKINTREKALALIEAGAELLGTSSAVEIATNRTGVTGNY